MASNLTGVPSENLVVLRVQFNLIFFKVEEQLVCAKNFRNFHELIIIVMSVEEWLFSEDL